MHLGIDGGKKEGNKIQNKTHDSALWAHPTSAKVVASMVS